MPFNWRQTVFDGWPIAKCLARYHHSGWWKMTLICWDSLFENWHPTHEAIRSRLVFTLLPVHRDMFSCPLHTKWYIYRYYHIHGGTYTRVTTGAIVPKRLHKLCDCAQGIHFWGWTQEIFMVVYVLFRVLVLRMLLCILVWLKGDRPALSLIGWFQCY